MTDGCQTFRKIERLDSATATPIRPEDQKAPRRDDAAQQPLHIRTKELVGNTIVH